jgi:hypothetical protein
MAREREPKPGEPEEKGLAVRPNNDALIPFSAASLIEQCGFSPSLADKLRELNDTLSRIVEPAPKGFHLSLTPDHLNPRISVTTDVVNPFLIDIAGFVDKTAAIKITPKETWHGVSFGLADLQNFAKEAFGQKRVLFHAEPIIKFEGTHFVRGTSRIPTNFYEEELIEGWRKEKEESIAKTTEEFLHGLLPVVEVDLDSLTEKDMGSLTDRIKGAQVDVIFYRYLAPNRVRRSISRRERMIASTPPQLYKEFTILVEGESGKMISVPVIHAEAEHGYTTELFLRDIYFRGTTEEVERALEAISHLFQQTHFYKLSKAYEQQLSEREKGED